MSNDVSGDRQSLGIRPVNEGLMKHEKKGNASRFEKQQKRKTVKKETGHSVCGDIFISRLYIEEPVLSVYKEPTWEVG